MEPPKLHNLPAQVVQLVDAWNACSPERPLPRQLSDAISDVARMERTEDFEFLGVPEVAEAVVEIVSRGHELDGGVLMELMKALVKAISLELNPFEFAQSIDLFLPALGLCLRGPACFESAAEFWRNILGMFEVEKLHRIATARGVDIVKRIRDYLEMPNLNHTAMSVILLTERFLCGEPMLSLYDINILLCALHRFGRREDLDADLGRCCMRSIIRFCWYMDTRVPGLERLLLRHNFFQSLWRFDILNTYSYDVIKMIHKVSLFSSELQQRLFDINFLNSIMRASQEDGDRRTTAYQILTGALAYCGENCFRAIVKRPEIDWKYIALFDSIPRMRPLITIDRLISYFGNHPREMKSRWPVLQLHVAKFVIRQLDSRSQAPRYGLIQHLTATPMSLCVRELDEVPIYGLFHYLFDGNGKAILDILHSPIIDQIALDLVWIICAVGIPMRRHNKHEAGNEALAVVYSDNRLLNRFMRMHAIIWALGIASLPRFQALPESKSWIPRELWRMVWEMMYE